MKLLKNNLNILGNTLGVQSPNSLDFAFPQLPYDKRRTLIPKESTEEKELMYKEGDKMRIPGVLDYTGAKYPFKKIRKGQEGLKWIRVKSNSGKHLYVPTRKDKSGKDKAIEYDAQGRFSGYETPNYNSPRHIISHFTEEEKQNPNYGLKLYDAGEDLKGIEVIGNKNKKDKIKNLFKELFGDEIGEEQYLLIETISKNNNIDLNKVASKYFELWNKSGHPKLGHSATAFLIIPTTDAFIHRKDVYQAWNRAMINPLSNYIHYESRDPSKSITEFSHFFNLNSDFIKLHPEFEENLLLYITEPSDKSRTKNGVYYESGYEDPTHNEYKAHKIMESLMWLYLIRDDENDFDKFLEKYLSGNDYRIGRFYTNQQKVMSPVDDVTKKAKLVPRIIEVLSSKSGSKIHIKKKNRGKFTEYCGGNVTQECINRAKRSGNKTLVKRAVFALNARKWNK